MHRGFRVECGSPLGILEPHRPKLVFLPATSLDEAEKYKPTMDIYTDSSYAWGILDPELEHYPRMPPTISGANECRNVRGRQLPSQERRKSNERVATHLPPNMNYFPRLRLR